MIDPWIASPITPKNAFAPLPDARECGEALVDITDFHPRIRFLASYYARGIEGAPTRCYVRTEVSRRLKQVVDSFPRDYSLAIFDALRPYSIQQALFDEYYNRLRSLHPRWPQGKLEEETCRFVARPCRDILRPPGHTTGGSVDLTLYHKGQPLPMGTDFDDFRPIAVTRYYEEEHLTSMELQFRSNRRLLYHAMTAQGFTNYSEEWWHYDYGNRSWAALTGLDPLYGYCETPKT